MGKIDMDSPLISSFQNNVRMPCFQSEFSDPTNLW